jgi:hypothetical protein
LTRKKPFDRLNERLLKRFAWRSAKSVARMSCGLKC